MVSDPALQLQDIDFTWPGRRGYGIAVRNFVVERGERVFLVGPSGSGKSSLLNLIAGLVVPKSGRIVVGSSDMAGLSSSRRDKLRADMIGLIFQQLNLVPYLSPVQNVCLSTRFSRIRRKKAGKSPADEAIRLLGAMGLSHNLVGARAAELSVGQQQRVAAARALMGAPMLLLADEPTSALDAKSRDQFMSLLQEQSRLSNAALIMVSHDQSLASYFDRVVSVLDIAETGYRA